MKKILIKMKKPKLKGVYRINLNKLKKYIKEFEKIKNNKRLDELNLISVSGIKLSIFRDLKY